MTIGDDLWTLIPVIYRRRDAEAGGALRALVDVLGEQAQVVEDDIGGLYANWFIETCQDWVVPYIADMLGSTPLAAEGEPASADEEMRLSKALPQRLAVANALRSRRRKGCVSVIEELARDVSRWRVQVVEFGTRVVISQDIDHVVQRGRTARISGGPALKRTSGDLALARLGAPDFAFAQTADIRSPASFRTVGRGGANGIGVYVARLETYPVVRGEAYCVDEEGSTCFCFDGLGQDVPLFHPEQETATGPQLAGPVLRQTLGLPGKRGGTARWRIDPALYGPDAAIMIWRQNAANGPFLPVPATALMPVALGDWKLRPPPGFVAIDPERGRLAFPEKEAPRRVQVNYSYASAAKLGGGAYLRQRDTTRYDRVIRVGVATEGAHEKLRDAVAAWRAGTEATTLIEFIDSNVYSEEHLEIDLSAAARDLTIAAAPGTRPMLRLLNYEAGGADAMRVVGGPGSLRIEGLLIGGRGIALVEQAGSVTIRHCTLVPGWTSHPTGGRGRQEAPSLAFQNCTCAVSIECSIIGQIFQRADSHIDEALCISISDSIVDAAGGADAFLSPSAVAYVSLSMRRTTVLGATRVHAISLVENSIFTGPVTIMRRQQGCLRFCYVPQGSRTPRPFACLPAQGDAPYAPVFTSRRYGAPGYCQLAATCPLPVKHGADDQSELGVYHDLYQPQREANLRLRLAEHLPASTALGIIYTT